MNCSIETSPAVNAIVLPITGNPISIEDQIWERLSSFEEALDGSKPPQNRKYIVYKDGYNLKIELGVKDDRQ